MMFMKYLARLYLLEENQNHGFDKRRVSKVSNGHCTLGSCLFSQSERKNAVYSKVSMMTIGTHSFCHKETS